MDWMDRMDPRENARKRPIPGRFPPQCRLIGRLAALALLVVSLSPCPAAADRTAADRPPDPRAILVLASPTPEGGFDALLPLGVDLWSVEGDRATVLADPAERKALLDAGFTILGQTPLSERWQLNVINDLSSSNDGYYTYDEYVAEMAGWAADHPEIVALTSIGASHQGRDIWLLTLSDNPAVEEDEPAVVLLSLQHAREWLSGMTLRGIAADLIDRYGSDPVATDFLDSLQLHFVLVANPDGYVYTHTTDRYWRKNRRDNGDGTFGVDLNRNFPFQWENVSAGPGTTLYAGPSPLSEPENRAVVDWMNSLRRPPAACLNYHTYGTRVMHNWAYTYDLPPNTDLMGPLARDVAFAIESVNGQRMRNGSWAIALDYTGGGTTNDYFHATLGIPTLTLELRPGDGVAGDFAPPGTFIAPSVSENIAGCETFLAWVKAHADDPTSPTITGIQVSGISNTRATVAWDTDDPADRAVTFAAWGSSSRATRRSDRLRGLHHRVTLADLTPDTLYHARVRSENLAGLASDSEDFTFRTTAVARDLTPPAAPTLLCVRRYEEDRIELRWTRVAPDVAGYRIYQSGRGTAPPRLLYDESLLDPLVSGMVFDSALVGRGTVSFHVTAVDGAAIPNESIPSDTYAVSLDGPSTSTTVLLVDGYDRWRSRRESQGRNHAFAADHGIAVGAWRVPFDTCANEALGSEVLPDRYTTILWSLGDESTTDETFSAAEQTVVRNLLERGGNLFVSGSEIAYDLDRPSGPTAADREFHNVYLFADYALDTTSVYDVNGAGPGTLFGSGVLRFDDGSRGIYRVGSPDAITTLPDATPVLNTATGRVVGLARTGLFGSGAAPGRLVYLCFPFETVFPEGARIETMGKVLEYFGLAAPADRNGLVVR